MDAGGGCHEETILTDSSLVGLACQKRAPSRADLATVSERVGFVPVAHFRIDKCKATGYSPADENTQLRT